MICSKPGKFATCLTLVVTLCSVAANAATAPKLNKTKATIEAGKTVTLKVKNAGKKKIKWSTSQKTVAKVSSAGKVTGVNSGKATITAKVGSKKLKCTVTVKDRAKLNVKKVILEPGYSYQLEVLNLNGRKVKWASSKKTVATVTKSGGVVAQMKEGTSTITATIGKKVLKCKVTVKKPVVEVTDVSFPSLYVSVNEDDSTYLSVTVQPSNATDKTVKWTVEDPTVATVDKEGKAIGISEGRTKITATCGEKSDYCYITVNARVPVENRDYRVSNKELRFYENEYDSGEQYFNAIYEITNIGKKNLKLGDAVYDVYDAAGRFRASEDMISCDPDVIKPGEKGYVWNNFKSLRLPIGSYEIRPPFKFSTTTKEPHYYPVSNLSLIEGDYGTGVKNIGTITNDTSEVISYLYIVFVHYDANGKAVNVHGTSLTNIAPGATQGFEAWDMSLPEYLTLDMIKNYKVIAATSVY